MHKNNHILPIGPRALKRAHQVVKIKSFYSQGGLGFALGPMGRAQIALLKKFKEVDLVLSTKYSQNTKKTSQKFHNKHLPSSICHYYTITPHLNICAL